MKTSDHLIHILQKNHLPLTEQELRVSLGKLGVMVNKTTVYRALDQLRAQNQVKEVEFGDGKKRFELNLHQHHHHFICTNCNLVEDIFVHNDVKHVEDKIRKEKKFEIKSHSLEFFGLCKICANN